MTYVPGSLVSIWILHRPPLKFVIWLRTPVNVKKDRVKSHSYLMRSNLLQVMSPLMTTDQNIQHSTRPKAQKLACLEILEFSTGAECTVTLHLNTDSESTAWKKQQLNQASFSQLSYIFRDDFTILTYTQTLSFPLNPLPFKKHFSEKNLVTCTGAVSGWANTLACCWTSHLPLT